MVISMNKVSFAHPSGLVVGARDPNEINKSSQIVWSSIVGEPESYQSPEWVWKVSSVCFTFVTTWVYKILTVLVAPIIAFIAALLFSIIAILKIWFVSPINKLLHVIFASVRTFLEIVLQGVFSPCFETIGLCLSNLKVRHQRIYEAKDEPQYPFII